MPNPFNGETVIRFALPADAAVTLTLYNMAGQEVARLVQGWRRVGEYALRWQGRDAAGRLLASGTYMYVLQAGERVERCKLTVVR